MSWRRDFYQIIATLGPAVDGKVMDLIKAGATGFRLNCSHLTWTELSHWLVQLENGFRQKGDAMPVWLDLQGTKLRVGKLTQPISLKTDDMVSFSFQYSQQAKDIPLPHQWIFNVIASGDDIALDDGKITLKVVATEKNQFLAMVIHGGILRSFKGFVLKNRSSEFQQVSDRDRTFIEQTLQLKFVGYAISYLQTAEELNHFKQIASKKSITAKIERKAALDNLREIADMADVCWLCRGDLGTNTNLYELHRYEQQFSETMKTMNKPFLIAGQVLENMVNHSFPSRSEIAHLGYLMENGFTGVVLSDETAVGKYPLQTVEFCREYFDYLTA